MTATSSASWMSRPGVIVGVRVAHAVFFLIAAAYCFLSYSSFAYAQFLKPNVVPAVTEFVMLSQWYYSVVLLTTTLTLMPQLRRVQTAGRDDAKMAARARGLAIGYVTVWGAVGVALFVTMPLRTIGNSPRGFVLGLLALAPPIWLALIDHAAHPAPAIRPSDPFRALIACLGSAIVVWVAYSLVAPLRLSQTVGIDLKATALAIALGWSLVLDLYCVMALFLAILASMALADFTRVPGRVEYWLFVTWLGLSASVVVYLLVCASLTFTGWDAAAASGAVGLALAAVWADVARLRSGGDRHQRSPIDALAQFSAAVGGVRSRATARGTVIVLPVIAYILIDAVTHFDWNFLLQKLTVLIVWLATFAGVYASLAERHRERSNRFRIASAPVVVFPLYHAFVSLEARGSGPAGAASAPRDTSLALGLILDRYAALDPSFRLIRDARKARSAETAEYYALLRSQTLIPPANVPPLDIDLIRPLTPAPGRQPDIFLFIVDSMRRDYVSPYNAKVFFTPEIGRLGAESFVFDRAFTRYAGTALAIPSIWSGGMMPHSLEQPGFEHRDTLLKLLNANHYVRMMNVDHIIGDLVARDANLVELDAGKGTMEFDLCDTVDELAAKMAAADPARPVFFYSLPQNVHIAIASRRKVPEGESYPGFFAPVASSVRRIDGCVGRFVDFLKRTNRYDNSIIIVTSDHGDSLGEEGRWGHAHFIVPEVMRIPLIVHVPSRMRARASVDLAALTFSSDITPSLYALLGYDPPDRGPIFGRAAFVAPDADTSWRRRGTFLLASSYGPAYAMLRHNGRRLYVVDAVDGRDNAFDVSDAAVGERIDITDAMTSENRILIRQHLAELARQNHLAAVPFQ